GVVSRGPRGGGAPAGNRGERAEEDREEKLVHGGAHEVHSASFPVSPVRMRTTCSSADTKTLPSPILPVRAAASIASMTRSTIASATAASIFTLGRKSTTYSAPRYNSVCPFCRPKPFTSVTVTPCTPIALRASRTSSSLNGLTIAVTIFIANPPRLVLKRLRHRHHR